MKRSPVTIAAAIVLLASLSACAPPEGPGPTTSTTTTTPGPAPQSAPLWGMVDMAGCPSPAVLDKVHGVLGGCVKFVNWADLEPTSGAYNFSMIDNQLNQIRSFNAKYPTEKIALKLRVLAGTSSPAWALDLGGPHMSISLCGPNATLPSCAEHANDPVPRFWTAEYGAAYDKLMRDLSSRYSTDLNLRDIVVTRCTEIFGEPTIRTFRQPSNAKALLTAGYTEELDLACQRSSIDLFTTLFPNAYVSESFSTYETPVQVGTRYFTALSDAKSNDLGDYLRAKLGPRGVLGNNELGRSNGDSAAVYAHQKDVGAPLYYQLDSLDRLSNIAGQPVDKWTVYGQAVQTAVDQGASYVEIRGPDYRTDIDGFLATLGPFVPQLRANAGL